MRFVFFLSLLLLPLSLHPAGEAGQPGGFLRAGTGARAMGMGNAYVAVASGAETALWNTAGLALLPRPSLSSSVSSLSLGRQFADATLAWPLSKAWGSWSLSWLRFSLGSDFEGRQSDTAAYYSFEDSQSAYVLGHGRLLASWLAVGAAAEFIEHRIDSFSASGYGLDLGALIIPHPKFHIGLNLSELLSSLRWSTGTEEKLPYTLRLGMSALVLSDVLLLSAQATGVEGRQASYQAGLELRYRNFLAARAGVNESGFTLGGGASLPIFGGNLGLDYAFAPDILGQGNTQRFSLELQF